MTIIDGGCRKSYALSAKETAVKHEFRQIEWISRGKPNRHGHLVTSLSSSSVNFVRFSRKNTQSSVATLGPVMKNKRSGQWFQSPGYYGFSRRAWLRSEGFPADVFD